MKLYYKLEKSYDTENLVEGFGFNKIADSKYYKGYYYSRTMTARFFVAIGCLKGSDTWHVLVFRRKRNLKGYKRILNEKQLPFISDLLCSGILCEIGYRGYDEDFNVYINPDYVKTVKNKNLNLKVL